MDDRKVGKLTNAAELRSRAISDKLEVDSKERFDKVQLVSTEEIKELTCRECGKLSGKISICVDCQKNGYDRFNARQAHQSSRRFHEVLRELGDLHDQKQADYGKDDDPFANVRGSEDFGVEAWVGAMVRASDKIRRLQSLIRNGKLENESAEDSLRDLAVYSVIALVLLEEKFRNE